MLYIQMEFCPRTLRQVLDEGPLEAEDLLAGARRSMQNLPICPLHALAGTTSWITDGHLGGTNMTWLHRMMSDVGLCCCRLCGSCWQAWLTSTARASFTG